MLHQLPRLPSQDSARAPIQINWEQLFRLDNLLPMSGRIVLILVSAFLGYRLVKLLVRRIVSHEVEAEDPIVKRAREQRAQTLGSLFQNVALIFTITITALTIMSTLGLPIGPLLAGVSVIGLAVSFGAQSLVKDVISGTFVLLEGQYGIGDVVRVGDTAGQVEKITLRLTILRDFEGVVHIIPNGEITRVSNLTKTWSRSVLDIRVAYREDVDRVIAVLRKVGLEFCKDPEWGPLLLDEPEVLGVQNFADSAIIIRMQARTLPLKQWEVARELRRRIKNRFDVEGIEIPFPHMTLYWGPHQAPEPGEPMDRAEQPAGHKR